MSLVLSYHFIVVYLCLPPAPTALESEVLLGDAARAAAEADVVKLRKEMAIASEVVASSASPVNIDELMLAKDTLQAQLNSERRRLQQLEHDHIELQQQEHTLRAKIASVVAAAVQKESEHAAVLAELRQQQQQWQATPKPHLTYQILLTTRHKSHTTSMT